MPDPSQPVRMPNWITRTIGVFVVLGICYGAATVALAASGDSTLPAPVNVMVTVTLASVIVGLLARGFTGQIVSQIVSQLVAYIDRTVGAVAARQDRRMNSIANGMIEHGILLEEITGEIPRVRAGASACRADDAGYAKGYIDGLAARSGRHLSSVDGPS